MKIQKTAWEHKRARKTTATAFFAGTVLLGAGLTAYEQYVK